MGRAAGNKYRAVRTVYRGVEYDSKSEASYARYLDRMTEAGKVECWSRQYRMPLVVNGIRVCTMVADFCVEYANGRTALVEVKGMETAIWRLKVKLLKALHSEIDYRVVKAREALSL